MGIEFDAWMILVALATFAAGWFAARVDIRLLVKESRNLPGWYFKGLNHLLNNQSDKAIESFVEVVKERPDTLELQYALGQLFRKQGEIEKATRIHQELLDRPHLPEDQRQRALYELAQDFNAAGFLDRAEATFQQLHGTSHEPESLKFLIRIYEMEKDWPRAIETTLKLEAHAKRPFAKELAQYHCEIAAAALVARKFDEANAALDKAMAHNKQCVRANVLRGDVALAQGKAAEAKAAWTRIETQKPAALGLVAERLAHLYRDAKEAEEGIAQLSHYSTDYPSQDTLNATSELIRQSRGDAAALAFSRETLRSHPTLSGLQRLLATSGTDTTDRLGADTELARGVLAHHTRSAGLYPCTRCGFRARTYYWHCPGCLNWESFSPTRQEASDLVAN
jgi:lipopolysaccharide assembly protein B